jgi:hypothetical protein
MRLRLKALFVSCDEMDIYTKLKSGVYYYSYDASKYNFYTPIQKILNCTTHPLEDIHTKYDTSIIDKTTFENDTDTDFHKMYYKSPLYSTVIDVYQRFISDVIVHMFKEDLVVQKEPSFRIHLPNNSALGKRKDQADGEIIGMHCDGDYNHPREEINFMITITGQSKTNSCYIESEPMKGDFFPLHLEKGQFASFYGNQCRHYNMLNKEDTTRISFDFRIIPKRLYSDSTNSAVHSNRKFIVGDYYTVYTYND